MNKRNIIDYCLTYPAVYEDYPFDDTTAVIRHIGNKKMSALIAHKDGKLYVNLKRIRESWHMNKEHWRRCSRTRAL